MKFRILGSLEIAVGAELLKLRGARQQTVVATLLLSANRVVAIGRLLEAMYGEGLPPTARSQAQITISALRRQFASSQHGAIITTHSHGYVIRVEAGELDAERFEETVAAAHEARDSNSPELAIARYRDALRLWRGPCLDGIDSRFVRAAAIRLDELRISSTEERIALELALGRHHELVGELTELVGQHPLREQLHRQLMLALYRSDRIAEALKVYRQARQTMVEELGIEPSERLQQLEHHILTSDPVLATPISPSTALLSPRPFLPNMLPADIADFTGRAEEISQIGQHLVTNEDAARHAVPVVVVTGKGGVGKTTLAVHGAHLMAESFPDGQLYVDLHGGGSHRVSPAQVIERFLRALGIPARQLPKGVEERAEMYRNLVADRKMLVLLDDVAVESQVAPLLPGNGAAGVIITSRSRLAGLAGAFRVVVDVFDRDKSVDLLARIADPARVQAQPQAAATLAEYCGHLPLALRIAGARLVARPHWSVQHLAERLADETRRLDELKHGEMGIRPSISLSYESADEPARRLFRRLALLDVPEVSVWLSSALLDQPVGATEDLLEDLVAANLIEVSGGESGVDRHYRFHDLLRVFARERLIAEETAGERRAALERTLGALLYVAEEARRRYYGGDFARLRNDAPQWPLPRPLTEALIADPLSWYDRERGALVAAVRQAAQAGFVELSWGLASSAVPLFESRVYLDDWRETHSMALEAARRARDKRGQAAMLYHLGSLHITQLHLDRAWHELTTAAQLFREARDDQGVAHATFHIASIDRLNGRLDDALRRYGQALQIFGRKDDRIGTAYAMHGIAQVRLEQDEFGDAIRLLADSLRLSREAHYERLEAQVLHRLGEAHLELGDPRSATDSFRQALAISRSIGDVIGEAYALQGLGVASVRQGDFQSARNALERAAELAERVGEPMAAGRALAGLSELELARGNPRRAAQLGQRAAGVFEELRTPLHQARALSLFSGAQAAMGNADVAKAASTEATALREKVS
jgi:DNA-binding SARP family transcriptional activator/Flp pilus assembly protein TadD